MRTTLLMRYLDQRCRLTVDLPQYGALLRLSSLNHSLTRLDLPSAHGTRDSRRSDVDQRWIKTYFLSTCHISILILLLSTHPRRCRLDPRLALSSRRFHLISASFRLPGRGQDVVLPIRRYCPVRRRSSTYSRGSSRSPIRTSIQLDRTELHPLHRLRGWRVGS
jgi:hypothetical protein